MQYVYKVHMSIHVCIKIVLSSTNIQYCIAFMNCIVWYFDIKQWSLSYKISFFESSFCKYCILYMAVGCSVPPEQKQNPFNSVTS